MTLYRDYTGSLFTEDEVRTRFDTEVLALDIDEDDGEEYPQFEDWHQDVSWCGWYYREENDDAR
jgi:hypothetical protein